MCDIPKVKELFTISNGIISHINYDFTGMDKTQLDILFISNYGERTIAPLVTQMLTILPPTDEELTKLASIIKSFYFTKWEHLKELNLLEYDPIHNYLDELDEKIIGSDKENSQKNATITTDMSQDDTKTNTRTDNLVQANDSKVETVGKNISDDSVYGFNSSDAVKSDSDIQSINSTEIDKGTINNTGTQINATLSKNTNKGTITHADLNVTNDDKTQTRISKHSGNIGNLTTQQLFNQELEVRQWNFINSVLEDIKQLLTLPIYM